MQSSTVTLPPLGNCFRWFTANCANLPPPGWQKEPPGQTLQATALVHEAWLRLAGGQQQRWDSRRHFFAAAAEAMRRILVEKARRRQRARHGGGLQRVDLASLEILASAREDQLIAIDEALAELEKLDPSKAAVVKLRYFV